MGSGNCWVWDLSLQIRERPRGGFSENPVCPQKNALTMYIMSGFEGVDNIMSRLGKHKTGKSCLYEKKLDDIDLGALEELVRGSLAYIEQKYP